MSDTEMGNEVEDVSFLPGPGQGGTGKRAVYEPKGSQRCKQIICSQSRAIAVVTVFTLIVIAMSLIAAFARPGEFCVGEGVVPEEAVQKVAEPAAVATNGEPFPWKDIRLPKTIIPTTYSIFMHPDLKTFKFKGNVTIEFRVKKATDFMVFHSKELNITSYDVLHHQSTQKIPIEKTLEFPYHEQVYIRVGETLLKETDYQVKLSFEGVLNDKLTGFYRSSYKTSLGEKRWLATTQFEPTDARAAFPCFDEPELKAYFTMSIIREENYLSLFNMPRKQVLDYDVEKKLKLDKFETSVKMSTYLVAFVVCDFDHKEGRTGKGINVSVYAPHDQISQVQFALGAAVTVLEYYEQFFGVDYPLPKQDLIGIPDFSAGAMENWGLITYRMNAILYDEKASASSNQQWVATVVAHELAHQWFGNLVTMAWWNDLWLNEGFAAYVEFLGVDKINSEWKMMDQFVLYSTMSALTKDSLTNSHPISVPVANPKEINEIFDDISYNKGSAIIRMLGEYLGMDALQNGLKSYLNNFKFDNAVTDDLWNSLANEVKNKVDVKAMMDTWTLQMGYPVVETSRNGAKVKATQKRFLLFPNGTDPKEFTSPFDYKWIIPLTYITDTVNNTEPKLMKLGGGSFDIAEDSKWYKVNYGQKNLYRVNYDKENWEALKNQLLTDHKKLGAADRAGLVDDAFALARAGDLKATDALDMTLYMSKERDYVPWKSGLANLFYFGMLLEDKPEYALFKEYIRNLIKNMVQNLGWEDKGDHLTRMLRGSMLFDAVSADDDEAIREARKRFLSWKNDGISISQDLRTVVYNTGIKFGEQKDWDFVWVKFKASLVPSETSKLRTALAATTDGLRLNLLLQRTLDDKMIRSQDTISVVSSVASNPAGKLLAWRFVKLNWKTFSHRYGGGSFGMSSLIKSITHRFTNEYDYEDVASFFKTHDAGTGKRAVSQALETIRMNIEFLQRNEADIIQWFKNHTSGQHDEL